jgi:predicted component of viral defense system (DUF524 family)
MELLGIGFFGGQTSSFFFYLVDRLQSLTILSFKPCFEIFEKHKRILCLAAKFQFVAKKYYPCRNLENGSQNSLPTSF